MARAGKKARFGDAGELGVSLRLDQSIRCMPALSDVDKGDDDAFDAIVLGAIGQYSADVPGATLRFDLSLNGTNLDFSNAAGASGLRI